MTAETANNDSAPESKPNAKSGGMMKMIVIGGGVFVLVLAIAVGAMMFLKEEPAPVAETSEVSPEKAETTEKEAVADDSHAETPIDELEALLAEEDPTVLDNIMGNLDFLDYQPEAGDMSETPDMAVEDSLENVNWLEQEKAALAEREQDLDKRRRELEALDREVTQKLLTLDQAESTRVNSLAKLYDGMDSRAVAQLMANLDDKTVVSILPRMKIKNASSVLALMPPKRAAKLSKQMITIAEK